MRRLSRDVRWCEKRSVDASRQKDLYLCFIYKEHPYWRELLSYFIRLSAGPWLLRLSQPSALYKRAWTAMGMPEIVGSPAGRILLVCLVGRETRSFSRCLYKIGPRRAFFRRKIAAAGRQTSVACPEPLYVRSSLILPNPRSLLLCLSRQMSRQLSRLWPAACIPLLACAGTRGRGSRRAMGQRQHTSCTAPCCLSGWRARERRY
jgi:hypothetical protein